MPEPHRRFLQTVSYIESHYGEPLSVAELARMNALSTSQFRRCFRAVFGSSPQAFITKVRIQAACRALATTDATIARIAAHCGFCDQSYFTRQFRALVGTSPVRYRLAQHAASWPLAESEVTRATPTKTAEGIPYGHPYGQ